MMFRSSVFLSLRRWPVESQMVSRRNAMIASTAFAQRRAEREEVADFLAAVAAREEVRAGAARG